MRGTRNARIVAVVSCALLVGAAGYPARNVSPKTYAKNVCTAVASWTRTVQSGATQLQRDVQGGGVTSVAAARASLASYLDRTVSKTDALVAALRKAGTPKTPKGKQVAKEFQNGFRQVRTVFQDARSAVQSMSTTDSTRFQADARAVGDQINRGIDQSGSAFSALKSLDPGHSLEKAFDKSSECKALNTSNSG